VARRESRKPVRESDFLRFAHPRARGGSHSRLPGREHGGLYGSTENRRSLQWSSRARRVSRAGCLDPPRRPLAKARKPTDPDTQVKGTPSSFDGYRCPQSQIATRRTRSKKMKNK